MTGWAPWIITAGSIALAGVMYVGKSNAERNAADERSKWDAEKAQIERQASDDMRKAIEAHNETAKQLETIHAESEKRRAVAAEYAASAVAAGAAAARAERRLSDAAQTTALAARAQAEAAGTAGQCEGVADAAGMLADVLGRIDSAAGQLAERARIVGGVADKKHSEASECSQWAAEVIR